MKGGAGGAGVLERLGEAGRLIVFESASGAVCAFRDRAAQRGAPHGACA